MQHQINRVDLHDFLFHFWLLVLLFGDGFFFAGFHNSSKLNLSVTLINGSLPANVQMNTLHTKLPMKFCKNSSYWGVNLLIDQKQTAPYAQTKLSIVAN